MLGAQCSVLGAGAQCWVLAAVLVRCSVREAPRSCAAGDLRGADALVRVYDDILDARFDQVEAELTHACAVAPKEACDVLAATATWWRILLDPDSHALDQQFLAEVDAGDPLHGGLGRARAAERRGALLRRRRLRRARPVARPARREARGRARRQAHQAGPRTRDRPRPGSRRCVFRDRAVPVLRRRRAGRREDPAVPPDAPGRQQDRGHGAHEAGARAREAPPGRGGLPAADSLSLVREARRSRRRPARVAARSLSRAIRCSRPSWPTCRIATCTTSRPAWPRGARCWRRPAITASTRRRSRRRRRAWASRASSKRWRRPITRWNSCGRSSTRGRRNRPGRWPPPTSRSAKGKTAWGTTTRRSRPTGWR